MVRIITSIYSLLPEGWTGLWNTPPYVVAAAIFDFTPVVRLVHVWVLLTTFQAEPTTSCSLLECGCTDISRV